MTAKFIDEDGDEHTVRIELSSTQLSGDSGEKPKASLKVLDDGGIMVFQFRDWNGTFGNSTGKPITFAKSDDGKTQLTFLASISKLSKIYRVELQIMSENVK